VTGGGVVSWSTASVSQSYANCEIWYGVVTTSSTTPITISDPVTGPLLLDVSQWSGLVTTQGQVLDVASGQAGLSGNASAGPITTTHAADFIMFAAGDYAPNTFGSPSGGTWSTLSALIAGTSGNQYVQDAWYQSVASTGTYTPTVSQTGDGWDACIAAFKIAP